jgi:hypothetical protein
LSNYFTLIEDTRWTWSSPGVIVLDEASYLDPPLRPFLRHRYDREKARAMCLIQNSNLGGAEVKNMEARNDKS